MDKLKKAAGKGLGIFCKLTCALAGGIMAYEGTRIITAMAESIANDITGDTPEPKQVETEA